MTKKRSRWRNVTAQELCPAATLKLAPLALIARNGTYIEQPREARFLFIPAMA